MLATVVVGKEEEVVLDRNEEARLTDEMGSGDLDSTDWDLDIREVGDENVVGGVETEGKEVGDPERVIT